MSSHSLPKIFPVPNATKPYWRSELHDIDSHRSTELLLEECDIAIIGAGMSGVATAYHLLCPSKEDGPAATLTNNDTKERPSIVILEAREVCSGATGRNGGHVKLITRTILDLLDKYGRDVAEQISQFCLDHIDALKDIVEQEDLDCEFELRRSFDVFLDEKDAREVESALKKCMKERHKWTKHVDFIKQEFAEQVTSIKGAKAALSVPACSLWPYKFVSQLLSRLVERKLVNLQTNTPVHRISTPGDVNILHTPRGTLAAKKVVFATNAYTAGISPEYVQRIIPTCITASHIAPRERVSPHLSNTYNIAYARENVDYLNPRPDGGIVVGGGQWTYNSPPHDRDQWWNNWDDSKLLEPARPYFGDQYMQSRFKGWECSGSKIDSLWTGIKGSTPDGRPHVGRVPGHEGLQWILAGFNGGGMPFIFLCAKGVARMMEDEDLQFAETGIPQVFETTRERLEAPKGDRGPREDSLRLM